MDRNGNVYTFLYASAMVILVAAILSVAAMSLKPFQKKNFEIEKMQNILASVNIHVDAKEAEQVYTERIINSYVVDTRGEIVEGAAFDIDLRREKAKPENERLLPVFECNIDNSTKYILPMRGAGLWGPIWGYISLEDDMNTIFGATFDHEAETPGLGAEISTSAFQEPFRGKKIFDNNGALISVIVAKSNESAPANHRVDAISGGTITSKGLESMILTDLKAYQAFFNMKK